MSDYFSEPYYSMDVAKAKKEKNKFLLHIFLFLLTFVTTTFAGMQWVLGTGGPYELSQLLSGLPYSLSIIFILACHEFGHYFAAKYHRVKATLPYFIPLPPIPYFIINFGTMGAVIRTKSSVPSNKAMFDIGVAGPIAGFIASLLILVYGFTHLPGVQYILSIHPDYFSPEYGHNGLSLIFGDSLLFMSLRELLTTSGQFIPPMSEIYHYPYLCVGWFGLFVTSMNMIPIGQLDGGHIVYSMFGEKVHYNLALVFMGILILLGLIGIGDIYLYWNTGIGWSGWLFWSLILFLIIKVKHPPVRNFEQLDITRLSLGYLSLIIFIISFSPSPLAFIING